MGIIDIFKPKGRYDYEEEKKTVNIDGFILDAATGEVINAPVGLTVYNIPKEATGVTKDVVWLMGLSAVEINFDKDSKIRELPPQLFWYCKELKKVQLPDSLIRLNHIVSMDQFRRGVTYNLPKSLEEISIDEIPKVIERIAVPNLKCIDPTGWFVTHNAYLRHLEIPATLEGKKPGLSNTQALETLVIHEGITELGSISGCNSLTNIYIPTSLTRFSLGEDDPRALDGVNGKDRWFFSEELQNRKLKIHKTINGQEVVFEVSRKDFSDFIVTDNGIIFGGPTYDCFKIPLESVTGNKYYVVDMREKTIEEKSEKHSAENQASKSPIVVSEEPSIFVKASGDSIVIPNGNDNVPVGEIINTVKEGMASVYPAYQSSSMTPEYQNGSVASEYKKILETLKNIQQANASTADMSIDGSVNRQEILDNVESNLRRK